MRLELHDVRPFSHAVLEPDPSGATVITGPNGAGKTTVLEALAYLGTQRSFRTSSRETMVRSGAERALLRATFSSEDRPLLVEGELSSSGSARTLVNRQVARSRADLARAAPVSIFTPGDLYVVQGPPSIRRDLLDAALGLVDRRAAAATDELERVLRQRGALLRQAAGRLTAEVASTLDVWDARLAASGEVVAAARAALTAELAPFVASAYEGIAAQARASVALDYARSWTGDLAGALTARRQKDLQRAITTVGPHHDDLHLRLAGLDARTHASQGEQRSLALALRLAIHHLVTERTGSEPLLLLDDVFSELDPVRSLALVRQLPAGQALLTTAAELPRGVAVACVVDVRTLERSE